MPQSRKVLRRSLAAVALVAILGGCVPTSSPSPTTFPTPSLTPSATEAPSATPSSASFDGPITARFDDGLPRLVGDVPVHRGEEAVEFAARQPGTAPFLVTGWVQYTGGIRYCSLILNRDWSNECGSARFADAAGSLGTEFTEHITFHDVYTTLVTGPVLAVVHVHDPRAPACGSTVSMCDAMMVAERIIWSGDAFTDPGPLTAGAIVGALGTIQDAHDVSLHEPGMAGDFCVDQLPGSRFYAVPSGETRMPAVTAVLLYRDPAAMDRASTITPGVAGAFRKSAPCGIDGTIDYRWFVVDNALFVVRTHHRATAADRAFLERLEALLAA